MSTSEKSKPDFNLFDDSGNLQEVRLGSALSPEATDSLTLGSAFWDFPGEEEDVQASSHSALPCPAAGSAWGKTYPNNIIFSTNLII
jgi:hypothetical protein